MTELDKIARAKIYMDKLSQGINPINDAYHSFGDSISDERMTKCFTYVSEILGLILQNGGVPSPRGVRKEKFTAETIIRESVVFSDTPITASELAKRINAAVPNGNMKRFSAASITAWLSLIGFISRPIPCDGAKGNYRPNEDGAALGITVERRHNSKGIAYTALLYSKNAQQFIVDNLDAVVKAGEIAREQRRELRRKKHEEATDNGV